MEYWVKEKGAKIVKFYPPEDTYINDPDLWPFYEKAEELNVVLSIHTGWAWVPPGKAKYALPVLLDDVARDFSHLRIIAFHMGYPYCDDLNMVAMGYPNVALCLSLVQPWALTAPRKFARILGEALRFAGPDRIIWGVDYAGAASFIAIAVKGFLKFQIPEDMQVGYGYPEITDDIRRKIFGENLSVCSASIPSGEWGMDKLSQMVSQYISEVRFEDLGATVIASAKRSALDTIGAMLAGSSASGIDTVVSLAKGWGGTEEAHVVGFGCRVPAPVAAWCNGAMARAREIDDCVDFLPVHPSASTVPALLALAEWKGGMSGRDFLTGLAVGQDLIIRMGLALRLNGLQSGRNNMFRIFGSTAALAKAMGFGIEDARNALGIAFSFAVGDGQCALDGALTLRLQQGIVAQGAVLSILLASKGFLQPVISCWESSDIFGHLSRIHE